METEVKLKEVPLVLSDSDERALMHLENEDEKRLRYEIFGGEYDGREYNRPPGRPDLTYGGVARLEEQQRKYWARLWKKVKTPRSRVMLPSVAWAWNLRKIQSKTDDLIRGLLKTYGSSGSRVVGTISCGVMSIQRAGSLPDQGAGVETDAIG